ncbi:LLM class flavin-dependent oxidoreductase [Pseudomonas sp. 5P_3.1_Bac2]|uniref:LLM class flavin-dependent oxidoreductase n=1 Tax=Pseudomonas sp. 5P_3.1_Bac2 TaxID=2971617 RepID=UPI0021C73A6D|nr:LLM class flavin-dependent oxidoreductase [Pseudomonas sp. 5P_3.1_Bac2]MCU1718185.1 LLM class flavin-dependent oxidoreductase [Pseudomonas sp. 5P_3.1_Bac2]
MSIEFFTRLPLNGENYYPRGDSRNRGDWHNEAEGTGALANFRSGDSFSYMDYLAQVARAAEINQFAGALMVNAPNAEEPWLTCALLARETRNLQFVTAFQPFHFSPFAAAQMASTYQRATANRLVWNIINGGSEQIQRQVGDTTAHDDRYLRASEFLDVVKGYWHSPQFHYQGAYYSAEGGGLSPQQRKAQLPLICTAGSSEAARELAAKHADYYLMRAEHPDEIRALIADVKARAQRYGRSTIRFGMSIDVISRPTEEEAHAEAKRFFDAGLAGAAEASKRFNGLVSARHLSYEKDFARQADAKSYEQFFVYPNVWAGFGFIGIPPGCALVGSYANVVARIREYNALGIELFFLAGYPHLEEAYRLGEHILPHFRHERSPLVPVSEAAATPANAQQEVQL